MCDNELDHDHHLQPVSCDLHPRGTCPVLRCRDCDLIVWP